MCKLELERWVIRVATTHCGISLLSQSQKLFKVAAVGGQVNDWGILIAKENWNRVSMFLWEGHAVAFLVLPWGAIWKTCGSCVTSGGSPGGTTAFAPRHMKKFGVYLLGGHILICTILIVETIGIAAHLRVLHGHRALLWVNWLRI